MRESDREDRAQGESEGQLAGESSSAGWDLGAPLTSGVPFSSLPGGLFWGLQGAEARLEDVFIPRGGGF